MMASHVLNLPAEARANNSLEAKMRISCPRSHYRSTSTAIVVLLCLLTATTAHAATMWLVDFGGSGTNPSAGGTWNVIKAPGAVDTPVTGTFALNDSTNTPANAISMNFVD